MNWPLAAVLPAWPGDFAAALAGAAARGFTHVEVAALQDRPADHLDALADAGLFVACAALSGRPAAAGVQARREVLRVLADQLADAARLGAGCVVLTPDAAGPDGEAALADLCAVLARRAAGRMLRLAVAPLRGSCLADGAAVLRWLAHNADGNLGLCLDGPDPDGVRLAADRLFHVRLGDPALPAEMRAALAAVGYRGALGVLPPGGWETQPSAS
jgi:sugar phosphate isomerase/epimerase